MAILVLEFDALERAYLGRALAAYGFHIRNADSVDETRGEQLVLLTASQGDERVISAITSLRLRNADAIVVVATDHDSLAERLACYAAGADDCVFKPFHLIELAAKIRALQRRRAGDALLSLLSTGDATLDCSALELRVADRSRGLTKREAELLAILARAEGEPVDREQVLREAWGAPAWTTSNSVDVYVGYVRRKLDLLESDVTVKTVRGRGFQVVRRKTGVFRPPRTPSKSEDRPNSPT